MEKTLRDLALIVVTVWITGLVFCLVAAIFDTTLTNWMSVTKDFSAMSSGIVGAIVGYYFGAEQKSNVVDPKA